MTLSSVNNFLLRFQKIPSAEKIFFVQHLRVMVKAGVSLAGALNALSSQSENKRFKNILIEIKEGVEKGNTFSKSLKKHKDVFGDLFVSMIEAGEISGKLESSLEQIFIQVKKDHEIKSKIKGAMIYPAVILFAMTIIGILMMIFVIPKLTEVFSEFNVELPLATRVLINASDLMLNHGILMSFGLIILITGFLTLIKTEKGKFYFHFFLLHSPIFGKIIKKINLARFSRTLSSLLRTDIPITKTLGMTSQILGNVIYKKVILEASKKVTKGVNIAATLKNEKDIFPPVVTEMVTVGEETGSLDDVLVEMAEFYEDEVDQTMKNLPAIIEPLLILVLGFGVALMAMAIIMPMYSLTETI
ncbi:type II secretion system F family protein [Candidatus Falkowbacteria bacterium]|jgi:type IV pilus assembly protein PilC|nr:type II secretion system F family protein [Candidatus Falkowbacteria bacterium]MBT4433430.1 type II secretion system F family protein [Candidatus Falkowbacteria bacterium]